MVTNCPQEIATQPVRAGSTAQDNALARAWRRLQTLLCGLHGHDPLLHFDNNRMYLRCASCGHETPGWELDQRRPRMRFRGDPRRQVLPRMRPARAAGRRIA